MLDNILMAISVGRRVMQAVGVLQKDVKSFRTENPMAHAQFAQLAALDKRTADLEVMARAQDDRLRDIEKSLMDGLRATEAVAQRAGMIFWIALAGCSLSLVAVVLSAFALASRR